jgi:murein DD-endopeptidase MepM/ murein hydrolase activator NlpD
MKKLLITILLIGLSFAANINAPNVGSRNYKFPLMEPIITKSGKILQTGWGSYQRPDMNGRWYLASNWPAREGSVVFSCNSGKVIFAGYSFCDRRSGLKIVILQDDGITVEYCHLESTWVIPPHLGFDNFNNLIQLPGQNIKKGDPIGVVGRTGRTTGSHLRLVMYINGKQAFFNSTAFDKQFNTFDYHVGNDQDLKFDIL